jgi:pilus assembly protein Flp/PilA
VLRESQREPAMSTFRSSLRALMTDERGVTALEYGLIAGLIAVVIVTSVRTLGTQLVATFASVSAALP